MKWDLSKQVEAVEITNHVHNQIAMDMDRTYSSMLFGHVSTEEKVAKGRIQVTDLLIRWLQCQPDLTYMQGMNLVMATCLRELQDEEAALHFFDFIIRQADPNLFHRDAEMLFAATQTLSVTLRGMVAKCSPSLAEKFANSDIDNMPILVQNWLIDSFVHVLPIAAAGRLWDRVVEEPGTMIKFASQLVLSGKQTILACEEEDMQEILVGLPDRVQSPEDVDWILHETFEDEENPEVEKVNEPVRQFQDQWQQEFEQQAEDMPVQVITLKPIVRMPKRWQPWKFITVAMVVPWLLMTATQLHRPKHSKILSSPLRQRTSLPAVLHVFPMHQANRPPSAKPI